MINTFDLSRYDFLQPRLARLAVWGGFVYSIGFPFISIVMGWDSTSLVIMLSQFLPAICLNIYYLLVLQKILQVQFQYRRADLLFILLYIAIVLQYTLPFWQSSGLFPVPTWIKLIFEFPASILYMFMLRSISMMEEDLFEEKFFFLFTGFLLSLCQLINSIGTNLGTEEVSGMTIVLNGLYLLLIFVHLLFLSRIFYSAHHNPHIPDDPAESLIDEIGEEEESP